MSDISPCGLLTQRVLQLTSTTRYGESRAAYREVQERHEDIRKIERTLAELAQMFIDVRTGTSTALSRHWTHIPAQMDVLVTQQDDMINAIETSATQVQKDTEAGYVTRSFHQNPSKWSYSLGQTEKAVESARSARRKRWFCFLLFLAVLAAVGIAVGVTVSNNKH